MSTDAAGGHTSALNPAPPASGRPYLLCAAAAGLVLFMRFPDGLLNAQLWAEDGAVFFKDALEHPQWTTLFKSYAGYLHLVPRAIMYVLINTVSIEALPLFSNLMSIIIAAASLGFFASPRFRFLIASDRVRWATVLFVAACHPATEILSTATNTNWYLTIASLLLTIAPVQSTRESVVFSVLLLVICFTSPLTICVLPVAVVIGWKRRGIGRMPCAAVVLGMAVHVMVILTAVAPAQARKTYVEPTSMARFTLDSLVGSVILQSYGFEESRWFYRRQGPQATAIAATINMGAFLALLWWSCERHQRRAILIVIGLVVMFLAMRTITMPPTDATPCVHLFIPENPNGGRYFFHAYCLGAFLLALGWDRLMRCDSPERAKLGQCILGLVVAANVLAAPRHHLKDYHWKDYIKTAARNNWVIDIPVNPAPMIIPLRGR